MTKLVAALSAVIALAVPAVAGAGASTLQNDSIVWVDAVQSAEALCTASSAPVVGGPVALAWDGAAPDGARMVVGCGAVQNDRTVAYASSTGIQHAAGTAVATVRPGGYTACATLFVIFNDGTARSEDHCP
jgi:hypothetical protein